MRIAITVLLVASYIGLVTSQGTSDEEIRAVTNQIWAADSARITGSDVQYNVNGPKLFTYVNEARFTGTYARLIALLDNYIHLTGTAETCGAVCQNEQDAFLDDVTASQPMTIAHQWLRDRGLASSTVAGFKNELKQYFFQPYTRSSGALDSSGFEHTFAGEVDNNAVSGFHNWVQFYLEEKSGDFRYGTYQATCTPEILKFQFNWLGYNKPISSVFMRSSPEVEMALYTVCFQARRGPNCPIRLGGVQLTMTVWDMSGVTPVTIGSAYPNC